MFRTTVAQIAKDVAGLNRAFREVQHTGLLGKGRMDFDNLMAGEPAQEEVAEPVETVEEAVEPKVEEEVEAAPAVEEPKPEPQEQRETHVPLAALISERDKARQALSDADGLRQQIVALQAAQSKSAIADPYDNPDEFRTQLLAQARAEAAREYEMKNFEASRQRALAKYGQDEINTVAEWAGQYANANPAFERELMSQPDPAEWIIALKKRNDEMQLFTTDREAFIRAEAAKLGLAAVASVESGHTETTTAKKQPPSLVNAKSRDTAARTTSSKAESFDDLMKQ